MREVRASNFVEQRLIGTPGSCPRERIAMTLMLPLDSMFLLMESREHPMHVGGLSLFVPPGRGRRRIRQIALPFAHRRRLDSAPLPSQAGAVLVELRAGALDGGRRRRSRVSRPVARAAQAGSSPRVARADLHAPRHAARSASAAVGGVRDRRSRRRPSCRVHEDAPRAHGWCVCCSGVVPQPLVGSARSTFDASMGATTFFGAGSWPVAGWTCRGGWAP